MFLLLSQTVLDEEETSTALCLASSLLVYKVIGRQMEVVSSGEMILHSQTFYGRIPGVVRGFSLELNYSSWHQFWS